MKSEKTINKANVGLTAFLVLAFWVPAFGAVTAYKHWNDGLGVWDQSLTTSYIWDELVGTGGVVTHMSCGNGDYPAGNSAFYGCVEFTPPTVIFHHDYQGVVWNNAEGTIECWIAPRWNGENQGSFHPNGTLQDVIIGDGGENGEWQPNGQGFNLFFYDNGYALTPGYQMFVVFVDNDGSNAWQNYEVGNTMDWVAGEWHHVCISWDASEVMAGIDGTIFMKKTRNGGFNLVPSGYLFGMYSAAGPINCWDGWADDLTIWNGARYTGLGDVGDTFTVPIAPVFPVYRGKAWGPVPGGGATVGKIAGSTLSWQPGLDVVTHKVYWSDNLAAVTGRTVPPIVLPAGTNTTATPTTPVLGTTYYWAVDEINSTGTTHTGYPWSYSILPYLLIDDMSQCLPASALSTTIEQDKWMLMPYECEGGISGTMAFAPSFISSPPITVPLNVSGWYAVYIGYWSPGFDYDKNNGTIAMVKLTGDGFRPLAVGDTDSGSSSSEDITYVREVFFDRIDLTGRDLVIAKPNGPKGIKLFLAYIKLVPLSPAEITEIQNDRADTSNRRLLGATMDAISYFHFLGINEPNDILQEVELYRHSDAAGVIWAVSYGDLVNYPSAVPGAKWFGNGGGASLMQRTGANDYALGLKQVYDVARATSDAGQNSPVAIAALHIKDMEAEIGYKMKFEAMFRLGIIGRIPGDVCWLADNFVNQNPQYNQVFQNGKVVHKASYAYPEVRQFMIDLIEETATNFDITGVSLCFTRGLHLIICEQPVADYLMATYGKDINTVSLDDPDLYASRAYFFTQFVSDVRDVLDTVGALKGEYLDLSVWVWPQNEDYSLGGTPIEEGLDVIDWIRRGLVDNVMCVDSWQIPIDTGYKTECELNNVNYVYAAGGTSGLNPAKVTEIYNAGVDDLAAWDIDGITLLPSSWSWIKRIGHKDEMANGTWFNPPASVNQIISINGIDISQGMVDAMYTGMWGP